MPPISATLPVAPGALQRIFAIAQAIKARPAYPEAIGLMLDIVGSEYKLQYYDDAAPVAP